MLSVQQDQLALMVLLVLLVLQDPQESLAPQDLQVPQEQLETLDLQA